MPSLPFPFPEKRGIAWSQKPLTPIPPTTLRVVSTAPAPAAVAGLKVGLLHGSVGSRARPFGNPQHHLTGWGVCRRMVAARPTDGLALSNVTRPADSKSTQANNDDD